MSNTLVVHKHRTNIVRINLGYDISDDVITSEIRSEPSVESPLLATWGVEFETDGTDGKLVLTLSDLVTGQIDVNLGYMDLKRVSGSAVYPVFDRPLEVSFRGTVTE